MGIDYVISWKSKVIYTFKLTGGYGIGIKFDNSVSVVEQNNYASEIVNAYIVYDLDTWLKVPCNNFT